MYIWPQVLEKIWNELPLNFILQHKTKPKDRRSPGTLSSNPVVCPVHRVHSAYWLPLVSLFTVLTITSIFEGVFTAPLGVVLEKRVGSSGSKKLDAGSLKTSSSTYRNAALKSNTFTKNGAGISKIPTPKSLPKGKEAGR